MFLFLPLGDGVAVVQDPFPFHYNGATTTITWANSRWLPETADKYEHCLALLVSSYMMLFCFIFLSLHIQIPNPSPLDVVFLLGCRITNPAKSWTFIILTCRLHWWLIGMGTWGHWGLGSQVPQPTYYQVRRLPQYFQLQTLLDSVVGWMPLC